MVRVADANGAEAPLLQGGGKPGVLPDDDHPFWVGPALSVYQNAGGPNTNWAEYETHRNHLGQPVIEARPWLQSSSCSSRRCVPYMVVCLHARCYKLEVVSGRGLAGGRPLRQVHQLLGVL
jgi:hypothetical protein